MKFVFIFLSLLLIRKINFAQPSFFGGDASINISTLRMYSIDGTSSSTVFNQNVVRPSIGFFYQKGISNKFSIRAVVRYMGLGYQSDYYNLTTPPSTNIDYLTFQISINYHINKHLNIVIAPYLSFTLGGTQINNQEITKTFHKNDHGFSIGAEYDVYKNFAMGLHYYIGLKNIILNDSQNGIEITDTNRTLQIVMAYKFRKLSK